VAVQGEDEVDGGAGAHQMTGRPESTRR
jgi:hypothetical protein